MTDKSQHTKHHHVQLDLPYTMLWVEVVSATAPKALLIHYYVKPHEEPRGHFYELAHHHWHRAGTYSPGPAAYDFVFDEHRQVTLYDFHFEPGSGDGFIAFPAKHFPVHWKAELHHMVHHGAGNPNSPKFP